MHSSDTSAADRAARGIARVSIIMTRVSARVSERIGQRLRGEKRPSVFRRLRQRMTRNRNRVRDDEERLEEKQTRKPREWLNALAITIRAWQWLSALIIYASFIFLLFNDESSDVADQTRTKTIEGLVLLSCTLPTWPAHFSIVLTSFQAYATILYHTNVLLLVCMYRKSKERRGWPVFAVATIALDLWMISIAISKMADLSAAGVTGECRGYEKTKCESR